LESLQNLMGNLFVHLVRQRKLEFQEYEEPGTAPVFSAGFRKETGTEGFTQHQTNGIGATNKTLIPYPELTLFNTISPPEGCVILVSATNVALADHSPITIFSRSRSYEHHYPAAR
jgi:hypothetical protein